MRNILEEVVSPAECAFLVSLPTTVAQAAADLARPEKDYIHHIGGVSVFRQLQPQFERTLPQMRATGAHVFLAADRSTIKDVFEREVPVVIPLAHWAAEEIELYDGLISIDNFVGLIPRAHAGIIDLSICHPDNLGSALFQRRPGCRVVRRETALVTYLELMFYVVVFETLFAKRTTYLQALNFAIAALRERFEKS